jgi:hypothetical protein
MYFGPVKFERGAMRRSLQEIGHGVKTPRSVSE